MKVKFKKLHSDAVLPTYGTEGSAGLDITAISKEKVYDTFSGKLKYIEYKTGLSIEIPLGYTGLIFPRSSISNKNLSLSNSVGLVDSDFRGEISFRFKPLDPSEYGEYEIGDRIGQIVLLSYPKIELVESDELTETERGHRGYGSTDIPVRSQAW